VVGRLPGGVRRMEAGGGARCAGAQRSNPRINCVREVAIEMRSVVLRYGTVRRRKSNATSKRQAEVSVVGSGSRNKCR